MIQNDFDVLLVGTGVAATATAIRLMQFAAEPLSIVAVERFPQRGNGGLAYGAPGSGWYNIYNIQAGRMSIFREDVDDFLRWVNKEADRRHWPEEWAETTFTVSGPAPRHIYADYMTDRLNEARTEAPAGSVYREIVGEVIDVSPQAKGGFHMASVHVQDGTGEMVTREIRARQVIIATGNEFHRLPFIQNCYEHPCFIRLQYSSDGYARLSQVRKKDKVVIIGSALSGYDAAITLSKDFGHKGPVLMISRHGECVHTYPKDHLHAVITVRRPPFLDKGYRGAEQLIEDIEEEWQYLCKWLESEHPGMPPSVYSERILKAWEPYVVELVAMMPANEVQHLLHDHNSLISNHRVASMSYATEALDAVDLEVMAAHIDDIAPSAAGGLTVRFCNDKGSHSIDADLVISNLNRETDYGHVKNPLWRNLIERHELAMPHRATGRGIEVGPFGELVAPDGSMSAGITTVGMTREGDEIARHGRLGPFAFNVATLKNHSIAAGLRTIAILEGAFQDGDAANPVDRESLAQKFVARAARTDFGDSFDAAAGLKVHWYSARTEAEKKKIQKRVRALERKLCGLMTKTRTATDKKLRRLRAALVHEANRRMTDVTMTPLELRHHLGLAEDDGKTESVTT